MSKTYYVHLTGIGKCRHIVTYCSGEKFHEDGSLFWDIQICSTKKKLQQFIMTLLSKGYTCKQ